MAKKKSRKKRGPRLGRKKPVDKELISHLMEQLEISTKELVKGLPGSTRGAGIGLSERTITNIFSEGRATDDVQWKLLDYFRFKKKWLINEGKEEAADIKIPATLAVVTNASTNEHTVEVEPETTKISDEKGILVSRFDVLCKLSEAIRRSETPQVLYAIISEGSALKCLMDGLNGAMRESIEKIVVRGWDYCPYPNDFDKQALYMYEIIERRIQLLKEISEGEGFNTQLSIEYYNLKLKPTFYALMYGKGAIYCGHCGICDSIYKEIGSPMYKMTGLAGEKYLEWRNMMMYGEKKAPEAGEERQKPFDKFPNDSYPYARLTGYISRDLLFSKEQLKKKLKL